MAMFIKNAWNINKTTVLTSSDPHGDIKKAVENNVAAGDRPSDNDPVLTAPFETLIHTAGCVTDLHWCGHWVGKLTMETSIWFIVCSIQAYDGH